jgi:acetyl esterase
MVSGFADEALAKFVAASPAPLSDLSVADIRAAIEERAAARQRGPEMHEVRDLRVAGLRARLYRPRADGDLLLVYFHGGGWTIGSIESHDRACRRLAAGSECAVLSVDYRLAPEYPWPASVDDAVASLRWVARAADDLHIAGTVAVGGDSAGGTLAALACLRLRDEDPEALPDVQVLLYANTDLTGAHASMREKAVGWGLDAATVRFFNSQWVPDEGKWSDPRVSPLRAPDLSRLPPALIVTAEHDVLRDEGEAYAQRLHDASVPVHAWCELGLIHNFLLLDDVSPACAAAVDRVAAGVGVCLSSRSMRTARDG